MEIYENDLRMKLVSRVFPEPWGRRFFRMIVIDDMSERYAGAFIVVVSELWHVKGVMPAGILLDVHKRYFRIKSPESGQILCINKADCLGWTTVSQLEADIMDMELQGKPELSTDDFIPVNVPENMDAVRLCGLPETHLREWIRRMAGVSREGLCVVTGAVTGIRESLAKGMDPDMGDVSRVNMWLRMLVERDGKEVSHE